MKRMRNIVSILMVVAMSSLGVSAQTQRQRPYRNNDYQTRQIVQRIETRTETFRNSLSNALNNGSVGGTRAQSNIEQSVNDFSDAVRTLHEHLDRRMANNADVQNVLNRATRIDTFVARRNLDARAQDDWNALRADLNELASAYNIYWQPSSSNNNQTNYPPSNRDGRGGYNNRNALTGTYRLDTSRSDDARQAAERAVRNLPYNQRQRVLDSLTARLESPDQIAIDKRGRSVTIASSRAPQLTFEADGQERTEQTATGRSIRARATLNGDQLIISSTGDRGSDFSVTIEPIDNGQRLSVRRTIYTTNLTTPVVVQSIYDRTSDVAQLDIFNGPSTYPNDGNNTTASGDFVVPNNTTIIATLNDNLSTATAREGDRFTMTVREPSQYQGATIEGHITGVQRSGRITGRSGMTFNFDTIRLQNGGSYRFAGLVENATTANGENVRIDTEGAVQEGDSRGNTTAQRAAIGTAIGAIIGAVAGGGKGAAIGAVIGAGGGAGSVYVQGRDDLELRSGTDVTIRATGPR